MPHGGRRLFFLLVNQFFNYQKKKVGNYHHYYSGIRHCSFHGRRYFITFRPLKLLVDFDIYAHIQRNSNDTFLHDERLVCALNYVIDIDFERGIGSCADTRIVVRNAVVTMERDYKKINTKKERKSVTTR